MVSISRNIRFRWPERRICFHQPENHCPLTGMHLKIRSHQTEKQSQQWQRCIKMEEKKGFHQSENQLLLAGIRLFFKNWISRFPQTEQKYLNEIILFQLDRKLDNILGFHLQELRIHLRISCYQTGKLLPLTEMSKKSKKMVANSSNKGFKQASL